MALDQTIALQVRPVEDKTWSNINSALSARKAELETQRLGVDVGALKDYSASGDINDLKKSPQLFHTAVEAETANKELGAQTMARAAHSILAEADPKKRQEMWSAKKDEFLKRGWVDPTWAKNNPTPSITTLNQAIRLGTDVTRLRESTGQAAEAAKGATSKFDHVQGPPDAAIQFPNARPGAPTTATPPGTIGFDSPPGTPTPTIPGAPPVVGSTAPIVPNAVRTQSIPSPSFKPSGQAAQPQTQSQYYNEAPSSPVAPETPSGPGVIQRGQHPIAKAAGEQGLQILQKEVQPASVAAAKTKASLGTMRAELEKGNVTTDRLADLKLTIAGFINAVAGDNGKTANALTGVNMSDSEVFNKESTRMGLLFARQTEGAREAVQAIRIALGANPSLLNSKDGNLKIIKIMDAAADYDLESGKAAQAYYKKQLDTTGTGHLVGFDQWFSQNHSPAAFMSKAAPYAKPASPNDLKDGVTYEWQDGNKTITGTYDAKRGGFVH